jgi:hypothetical protein
MICKLQLGPRQFLAVLLCQLVWSQSVLAVQTPALRVVIGRDTQNVINEIPEEPLAVRILDADGHPVQGASVEFTAPASGASGTFPTGLTFTTITDQDGRALGLLYRPNAVEGAYTIRVRATYMGEVATGSIRQTNVAAKKAGSNKKVFAILAAVGVGAAVAAVSRGGGGGTTGGASTPSPSTPTITFGGATVGGQ